MLADLFDRAGEYETAALLDTFIDKANAADGDIIKQAGFWSNILKRLKGKSKRIFFSVYRELHDKAKEAQEAMDEEISDINEKYKQVKQRLKVYELVDWRYQAQSLGLADIDNIMSGYDQTYAKLIGFFNLNKGEGGASGEELSQIDKLPGVTPGTAPGEKDVRVPGAKQGWRRIHPRVTNVQANSRTGDIRIKIDGFQDYLGVHIEMVDEDKVKFIEHEGELGRLSTLKSIMGDDTWHITMTDKDWAYLSKDVPKEEEEAPPIVEEEETSGFEEEPELPGTPSPEPTPKAEPEIAPEPVPEPVPITAPEEPEEVPEEPEEVPETPEPVPEEEEAPEKRKPTRERVWVVRKSENPRSRYVRTVAKGYIPYTQILQSSIRAEDVVEEDSEKVEFLDRMQGKTGKNNIPMPKDWKDRLVAMKQEGEQSPRTARRNRILELTKLS